jgi:hypothetical protein
MRRMSDAVVAARIQRGSTAFRLDALAGSLTGRSAFMAGRRMARQTFRRVVLSLGPLLTAFFLLAFVPKIISVLAGTAPELPAGRKREGQVMTAMFVIFMRGRAVG